MTENFYEQFNIDKDNLSENDTLYSDLVIEIMSSWVNGDSNIIETVTKSIANDVGDNETVMPGLLFGALLHLGVLIAKISTISGKEMDDVWAEYLTEYGTGIRKNMSKIPVLHPQIALKLAKAIDDKNNKGG